MRKNHWKLAWILAVVLLLNLLLPGLAFAAGTEAKPTFEVGTAQGKPGDTKIEIPIRVKNNSGIASIKLNVTYDKNKLNLTGAKVNMSQGMITNSPSLDAYPYILNWVGGTYEHSESDFTFATLTFSVLDNAAFGYTAIKVTYDPNDVHDGEDKNVKFETENGGITIPHTSVTASINAPFKGTALDTNVKVGGATGYTGTVAWYEGNSTTGTAVTGTAKANQIYTAKITLTADEKEIFDSSLNGKITADGYRITKVSDTKLTLTKTFPATLAKELQSLTVTTQPSTTTYTHGDKFNSAGMVVKATYDDGTADENFTGYAVEYVTAGKNYLKKGDTKVTLKAGNKSVEVNNLTVNAKTLAISGLTATDRTYDRTTNVTLSGGTLTGVVSGETVSAEMPTTGTTADANVGNGKAVTISTITLAGNDAGNYTLTQPTVTVNINKADPDIGTVSKSSPEIIYPHTNLDTIMLSRTNEAIAGTLTLNEGQTLTVGTKNYNWTFKPGDTNNYNTKTGIVSLTVTEDKLTSIEVKTAPTKTAYQWGEEFSIDGAVIEATYVSGTKKDIAADKLTYSKALTVGQNKIIVSYTEDGVTKSCDITGLTVDKADARTLVDVPVILKLDVTAEQVVALSAVGMPSDAGTLTYTKGTEEKTGSVTVTNWSVDASSGEVKYTLSGAEAGDTVTLPVTISSTNYVDSIVKIKITLTDKNVPSVTVQDITKAYTGETVSADAITGTATFDGQAVAGVWTWKGTPSLTAVADSGVKTVVFTPSDTSAYATVEVNLTLTINKAAPAGTPSYTPITTTGKTLADAVLTAGTITPAGGTIAWDDGDSKIVDANTAYRWTYTPSDTANYSNLTGSITPYQKSAGGGSTGGSLSSDTITTTEKNPDGSTTTTTTDKTTGTVTETTENPDGSRTEVEMKKDGTVTTTKTDKEGNKTETVEKSDGSSVTKVAQKDGTTATVTTDSGGKTEAEVELSSKTVEDAQKKGETVVLPIPGVTVTKDADTAPVVTVKTGSKDNVKVEIPTVNATPGVVAVIVNPDGSEQVIRKSVSTEHGVMVALPDGATVKIVDNSKQFSDVPVTSWASGAVAFASSHEMFNGTSETAFSPNLPMSRSMLAVVLHNLENNPNQAITDTFGDVDNSKWYAEGVAWAADQGIIIGYSSDKFGPNDDITREQLAVMLWRYAGEPAAAGSELNFTDADKTSSWAAEAMLWATEKGIINGKGNGILDPAGKATRAETAQMLKNYLEH